MTPVQMYLMFTDSAYMDAVAAGDVQMIVEATMALTTKNAYVIGMLFANIAMILLTMLFCKVIQKRKMSTLGFVKKTW